MVRWGFGMRIDNDASNIDQVISFPKCIRKPVYKNVLSFWLSWNRASVDATRQSTSGNSSTSIPNEKSKYLYMWYSE
ncbi:hypothetical protein L6452_32574 [Arctium lappa]|uniref:Uncharacterized protein n=1 Tax=Arctium lappa TaxID=4217 RepID=A0ACB8Z420_ARCLA|nr:hypothetical protein L6452_32574 [Arctium lappa]